MAVTGKLSSHTEAFWCTEYQVSQADIDLVTAVILQEVCRCRSLGWLPR